MKLGGKKTITPDKVKEIIELRKQGWSLPKIGAKFGVDYTSIFYWLKKSGIVFDGKNPVIKLVKELEIRPCKNCGETFRPKSSIQIFCQPSCYYYFHNKGISGRKSKLWISESKRRLPVKGKTYAQYLKETKDREIIRNGTGSILEVRKGDKLDLILAGQRSSI